MECYDESYEEWYAREEAERQDRTPGPVRVAVWMALITGGWLLVGVGAVALVRLVTR